MLDSSPPEESRDGPSCARSLSRSDRSRGVREDHRRGLGPEGQPSTLATLVEGRWRRLPSDFAVSR